MRALPVKVRVKKEKKKREMRKEWTQLWKLFSEFYVHIYLEIRGKRGSGASWLTSGNIAKIMSEIDYGIFPKIMFEIKADHPQNEHVV
jgi:hypothetical protein